MKKGKILICGAGSVGIFLGAKLHSKKHDVHLFGRRKLREAGNKIFINNKKFETPNQIYSLPKKENYDFVFITSKLYDFNRIIRIIKRSKLKSNLFATIQNGLLNCSEYKKYLNNKNLIPITVFGGFKLEKNKLTDSSTSIGWRIENSREGIKIGKLVASAGIPCKPDKNIESIRAEKMIVNCCLNALSAIENKPFKQLFSEKRILNRIVLLFDECYDILGKEYSLDKKEKMKERLIAAWRNVNHYSSTHQDIVSGRKSEIDFFNGQMIKMAKKYELIAEENKKIIKEFKEIAN